MPPLAQRFDPFAIIRLQIALHPLLQLGYAFTRAEQAKYGNVCNFPEKHVVAENAAKPWKCLFDANFLKIFFDFDDGKEHTQAEVKLVVL